MHKWMQKLNSHTHFYSTTPRFPEPGPIPTDCCRAHPPHQSQSFSPGSPPSRLLLFPLSSIHSWIWPSPVSFTNLMIPRCKRQNNNTSHLSLLSFCVEVIWSQSHTEQSEINSFLSCLSSALQRHVNDLKLHFRLLLPDLVLTNAPRGQTGRQRQPALNCGWNWVSYSSCWIPFLSWRFGSSQTYRDSEQWEECLSGSGLASPLPFRPSTAFLKLFMTSVLALWTPAGEVHRLMHMELNRLHTWVVGWHTYHERIVGKESRQTGRGKAITRRNIQTGGDIIPKITGILYRRTGRQAARKTDRN